MNENDTNELVQKYENLEGRINRLEVAEGVLNMLLNKALRGDTPFGELFNVLWSETYSEIEREFLESKDTESQTEVEEWSKKSLHDLNVWKSA